MRLRRSRLVWVLLAGAVVLLLVAVIAGTVYVVLQGRSEPPTGWRDPIAQVTPDAITSAWALYPLAGASELDTIDEAIASGDLETAYAALVFGRELSDLQRIGRLTLLGQRFAQAENSEQASLCYQQIYDLALLSPALHDPARADALLSAGRGWAALGQDEQALTAYDQVYFLALQSPYLQAAQRQDLVRDLEGTYRQLGDDAQAQAAQQQLREWNQGVQPPPPSQPVELPDLPVRTDPVSSPEVGELEEARRQAVYALQQALALDGEAPAELVDGVAQALLAEDAAKLSLYQQELEASSQPGRRINVHRHTIRWLTVKYQVAMAGFGLSLVPEWEAELTEIQSALSKAFEDLHFDYEDLVTALPNASLIGPGRYQTRREVILAGRLGQYPNYPAQQLAVKLQDAATDLISAGAREQLYVDVTAEAGQLHFFLSPAERYGLRSPSP